MHCQIVFFCCCVLRYPYTRPCFSLPRNEGSLSSSPPDKWQWELIERRFGQNILLGKMLEKFVAGRLQGWICDGEVEEFVERLILFILLPNNMWASLNGCIPKVAMHGAYLIWHRIMTWWHHQRDARISRGVLHDSSTLNTESLTISMSMKKVLQWTLPLARRECLLSEITRLLKAVSSLKFLHVSY